MTSVGYEQRDVRVGMVVVFGVILVLGAVSLHVLLWEVSAVALPVKAEPDLVNDRIRAIPPPRLDPLEPVEATYRSSRPLPGDRRSQHPEDLRADRQPGLQQFQWIEPNKTARIPISQAMEAVMSSENARRKTRGNGK
jgi:hypothetical protein